MRATLALIAVAACSHTSSERAPDASIDARIAPDGSDASLPGPGLAEMKAAACNADNVAQTDDADSVTMLAQSSCVFIQRIVDLWASQGPTGGVPDLAQIQTNLASLRAQAPAGKQFVLGVFLPESIPDVDETVIDLAGQPHTFHFADFCRTGTEGWRGAGTCNPDLTKPELAGWIAFVEGQLLQLGITQFELGQIAYMDPGLAAAPLFQQMRATATAAGATIFISAQTNSITDAAYLANFDFIVGGSYLNRFGYVQPTAAKSGPTAETTGSALLWSDAYRSAAPAVFIETDWWNLDDDAHRFAELSGDDRHAVIQSLYDYYAGLGVGFVVPFHIPIVGGPTIASTCHGAKPDQYSASTTYCDDADAFNAMFDRGPQPTSTQSLAQGSITLLPGDSIQNPNGTTAVKLEMMASGALVATDASGATVWTSPTGTCGAAACSAHLQSDGNVVLRDGAGNAYWSTATGGSPGAEITLHSGTPAVEVLATDATVLWHN